MDNSVVLSVIFGFLDDHYLFICGTICARWRRVVKKIWPAHGDFMQRRIINYVHRAIRYSNPPERLEKTCSITVNKPAILPPEVVYLKNLTRITVRGSKLRQFPPVTGLRRIHIEGGLIFTLADFACMPELYCLEMPGNKITSLDGLLNLKRLLYLDVTDNSISEIGDISQSNLRRLTANNTGMTGISALPYKLTVLEITDNNFKILKLDCPDTLEIVTLAECRFLHELELNGAVSLYNLNISKTKVTSLDGLTDCPLKDLDASFCKINLTELLNFQGLRSVNLFGHKDIPRQLCGMPELHTIFVQSTAEVWECCANMVSESCHIFVLKRSARAFFEKNKQYFVEMGYTDDFDINIKNENFPALLKSVYNQKKLK